MNRGELELLREGWDFEAKLALTHARARELTERHSRDVTLKLQELLRRGYLESDGKTRGTTCRPSGRVTNGQSLGSLGNSGSSEESSTRSEESSEQTRGWSPLGDQLKAVRLYCRQDWRTLSEIAAELGRTDSTVRTMYLRPLLAQGLLERRYPDQPNHPLQAYRTTSKDP